LGSLPPTTVDFLPQFKAINNSLKKIAVLSRDPWSRASEGRADDVCRPVLPRGSQVS